MASHLEALARRLEDDPAFLACLLKLYAGSERVTQGQLAQSLGCTDETLVLIGLCRSPGASPALVSPRATALPPTSSSRKLTARGRLHSRKSMIAGRSDFACSAKSSPRLPGCPRASGQGVAMFK